MGLFDKIKNLFASKEEEYRAEDKYSVDAWYDSETRMWTAQLKDEFGNHIGITGHGFDKKGALFDLEYQNHDII